MRANIHCQKGLTFIELITAIVILGIVIVGAMSAITILISSSSDPLVRQQALYIAESYMDEIISKPMRDPGTNSICPMAGPPALRADYDDVCDYNNLNDVGAIDQTGAAIVGLEDYNVAVMVTPAILNAEAALEVVVAVEFGKINETVRLTGFRMEY